MGREEALIFRWIFYPLAVLAAMCGGAIWWLRGELTGPAAFLIGAGAAEYLVLHAVRGWLEQS